MRLLRALTFATTLVVPIAGVVVAQPAPLPAQAFPGDAMQLDPSRSYGDFRIRLLWLVKVGGRFSAVEGSVHVDPFRNQVRVFARIDVDALHMDDAGNEAWAKSAEFFDAAQYPYIQFDSQPIPQARLQEGGELPGELMLRGIRQSVRFRLQAARCNRPAYDCPIEVDGAIRRSDFGMRSRHATLGDRVDLRLSVYAMPAIPR